MLHFCCSLPPSTFSPSLSLSPHLTLPLSLSLPHSPTFLSFSTSLSHLCPSPSRFTSLSVSPIELNLSLLFITSYSDVSISIRPKTLYSEMWAESNFKYILLKGPQSCMINQKHIKTMMHVLQQRCR